MPTPDLAVPPMPLWQTYIQLKSTKTRPLNSLANASVLSLKLVCKMGIIMTLFSYRVAFSMALMPTLIALEK